jgi:hypothetical protein
MRTRVYETSSISGCRIFAGSSIWLLDRVLLEQTDKIRGDLQRMEPKLGTVSGGGKLSNELKRERQSASRLPGGQAEA